MGEPAAQGANFSLVRFSRSIEIQPTHPTQYPVCYWPQFGRRVPSAATLVAVLSDIRGSRAGVAVASEIESVWQGRRDSNPHHLLLESSVFSLHHTPTRSNRWRVRRLPDSGRASIVEDAEPA